MKNISSEKRKDRGTIIDCRHTVPTILSVVGIVVKASVNTAIRV